MNLHQALMEATGKIYAPQKDSESKVGKAINITLNAIGKITGRKIIFQTKDGKEMGETGYKKEAIKAFEDDIKQAAETKIGNPVRIPILFSGEVEEMNKGMSARPFKVDNIKSKGKNVIVTVSKNYNSVMHSVKV